MCWLSNSVLDILHIYFLHAEKKSKIRILSQNWQFRLLVVVHRFLSHQTKLGASQDQAETSFAFISGINLRQKGMAGGMTIPNMVLTR